MKPLFIFMSVLLLFSCKKEESLASKAAGNYNITSVKINNQLTNVVTGSIKATEKDEETIDILVTLKASGKSESATFNDLTLEEDKSGIDIYSGKDLVGTIVDKNILFFIDDDPDLWELNGKK
jgi:hypothetical protein